MPDNERFGKTMLEKMGWKSGKGLGKYEQGISSSLEVQACTSMKGLGYPERNNDVWIAHNDGFATLLADLNKKKEEASKNKGSGNSFHKGKSEIIMNKFVTTYF
ncbi:unnamed protein product [Thelazia callipaeda]|uniref:G-patch domain-containing protein n=1 Tax=Thelazia callipaeda TaxID=103827 RepID=A0A0N5CVQ5_THECL|nr:unnamed protein product [Thelazia callipaeda]